MKLYNLDRGDEFLLAGDDNSPVFILETLDGMYSRCYIQDKPDQVYHFAAFTPVIRYRSTRLYKE